VIFKDFKGDYIIHSNPKQKGWWHWDFPLLNQTPSNIFVRNVIEYGPNKGPFPLSARFIEFGILVNHNRANSVYRCGDYEIIREL
jgi:hypothetical protein